MTTTDTPIEPDPMPNWQPRFFTIWVGQAISLLGSQLVQFAIIWHLTTETGSAQVLTTATLVGMLPGVFLTPFIGTLVDRTNRRLILIATDSLVALASLLLALLFIFDLVQLWHIYLLLFLRAVGGGFHQSAMGASVVLMVPKEQLARVQGLNQTLNGGLNLISAPLAAALLAFMSIGSMIFIDVVTALFAVIPLVFISIPQPERIASGKLESKFWDDMLAGFRYIVGWPALSIILVMVTLINFLLTPTAALMPLLITEHFGGGALHLGWLQATMSGGIIVGGIVLGVWGGFKRRVVTAMLGLIGIGIGTLLLGSAPASWLWMGLLGAAVTGFMLPVTNGSFGAVLQASIAPEMQGRAFAFIFSLATAMSPLGLLIAGPVAESSSLQLWYWIAGAFCVAMGLLGFMIPAVMRFDEGSQPTKA